MNKPNVIPMPFPLDLDNCARVQALHATADALGMTNGKDACCNTVKWKHMYQYHHALISAQLRGAIAE